MQFSDSELGVWFDKLLKIYRKKRIRHTILYIVVVLYLSVPSFLIPSLEFYEFRVTSLMEQRALENYLAFFPGQSWGDIDEIHPNLLKCVISMEDGKFFTHKGIDWYELERSIRTNKRRKRIARGGSTITMQTAKNLFLSTDKNIFRKGKEFLITTRMEKELSKAGILVNYLNAIEWGDGIFGIKKASEVYFDKDANELNLNQCSRLAAVIPSPLKHKPTDNSGYVLRRSSTIRSRFSDILIKED